MVKTIYFGPDFLQIGIQVRSVLEKYISTRFNENSYFIGIVNIVCDNTLVNLNYFGFCRLIFVETRRNLRSCDWLRKIQYLLKIKKCLKNFDLQTMKQFKQKRNFVTHLRNNSQIFFVMFGEVYLEDKKKLKDSVADYYPLF